MADASPLLTQSAALDAAISRVARVVADEQVVATQQQTTADGDWLPIVRCEEQTAARRQQKIAPAAPASAVSDDDAWARWLLEQPTFPPICVRPPLGYVLVTLVFAIALTLVCVFRDKIAPLIGQSGDKFAVALLSFVSIPVVSIVFTYLHIWLALWMTFFPIKFVGCWQLPWTNVGFPIGWQGIVPWKGREMGRRACRLMTAHLVSVDEMLARLQPEPFARALGADLGRMARETVDAAGMAAAPRVYARLPERSRQSLYSAATATTTHVIGGILEDLRADAASGRGFNLERLVDRVFCDSPPLVSAMFITCGYRE